MRIVPCGGASQHALRRLGFDWDMYSLPKPGFDLDTMRAVAVAYRRGRQAGRLDGPAREAAIAAYRARHPEIDRLPASAAVAHIVAWAEREHAAWFWRGVGLPERRRSAPSARGIRGP